jgi:FkbM family methyltransferase
MKKIFLDCGSNRGQSIVYAKKQFGEDIEIHSFEAVPLLYDKLIDKWKTDINVKLYNNAVWDKVDTVKIYISTEYSDASTLYLEKFDRKIDEKLFFEIESVDMSDFIKNNFNKTDYIILKLDIEGAEYDVLYHLAKTGVLDYVDELWGEWHLDKFPIDYIINNLGYKQDYIFEKLYELGLSFKEWHVNLNESEKTLLTLDESNRMPLNEMNYE